MKWLRYVRCCLNCGSLSVAPNGHLCGTCWLQMELDRSTGHFERAQSGGRIFGTSIWDWQPQKNNALSAFLSQIKGWSGESTWDYLADYLVMAVQAQGFSAAWSQGKVALVPAPSSRPVKEDHARHLAAALSRRTSIKVVQGIKKESAVHQRGRARWERSDIALRYHENFSRGDLIDTHVILVDDVVTTGATAAVSFATLGPTKSKEIWCLANRALL